MTTRFEQRLNDLANVEAELTRINAAFSMLEVEIQEKQVLMNACAEKAAAANAAALLDGGSLEAAQDLQQQSQAAYRDAHLGLDTAKQILRRRTEAEEKQKAAKLDIANEFVAVAFSEWDRLSSEAVEHYKKFLEATRDRQVLAVTCTRLYGAAGITKQPFDESSKTRQRFAGEFGCSDNGLLDLAAKFQLVQTSAPLTLRLLKEVDSLSTERLIELAKKSDTAGETAV